MDGFRQWACRFQRLPGRIKIQGLSKTNGMRHFFTITWFDRKNTVTKRAMRHLFCWLACLCFMAMPTMADYKYFAIGDYYYSEIDSIQKNVAVSSNSIELENIVILDKVEYEGIEYNVTSIRYHAYIDHTEIKSVVIPNSVKTMNIKLLKVAQI